MTPIVYAKDDLQRSSNGLGRLTDCIECTVENNLKDYSCELHIVYPYDGFHADLINCANVIGVQIEPRGNIQLFDVYKISQDESGNTVVDAHHVRHRLKYLPTTWVYGTNVADVIRSLNMVHIGAKLGTYGSYATVAGTKNFGFHNPFVFWTNITRDSVFYQVTYINETAYGNVKFSAYSSNDRQTLVASKDVAQSFWDVLFGKDGLVTVYGLAVRFDNFNVYISEPNSLSADRTKDIVLRYGNDMKAFTAELDSSNFEVYTHAIPYRMVTRNIGEDSSVEMAQFFMEDSTISDSFPVIYEIPDVPMEVSAKRYLPVDVSNLSKFTNRYFFYGIYNAGDTRRNSVRLIEPEELEEYTKAMGKQANSEKISPSFSVEMVSLREHSLYTKYKSLESVSLGDVVSVAIEPIDMVVSEQILQTNYNVLSEAYNSENIGSIANNVADILFALAQHEESNDGEFDSYLDYSEELTPYTTENTLTDYDDGTVKWSLTHAWTSGTNTITTHTVNSEPIRSMGRFVTGNIAIHPTKSESASYTSITFPAGQWRKILEGLPIPAKPDVWFSYPTTKGLPPNYDGDDRTVYEVDYHIDSVGDLYFRPKTDMTQSVTSVNNNSSWALRIPLQYITAEGSYDDSWKNYIITTSNDWKERESV